MREGAIRRDQDRRCQRRGKHKRSHGSSAAHSGLEAGGKYGLVLLALSGAAGANVTGSPSAFVQSAAVNYLQGLGAAQVKQIADSLGRDPQAEAARENEVSDCNLGEACGTRWSETLFHTSFPEQIAFALRRCDYCGS